jgi:hypothetical protein
MKQNMMILSEREIQKLVKQILLKEQSGANRTITDIQNLLIRKGRREVGTSDGKAGLNTLTAINNALNLGLNLYRPQAAKQNTQTNVQQNIMKSPSAVDFEKINPASKDGNLQGVTTNQGTEITPAKQNDYAANNLTGKKEYVAPTLTDQSKIVGLTD